MKRLLCQGILKGSLLTALALAGLTPMLLNTADAGQASGLRFGVGFGNGVRGYPVYGRGGYGYGRGNYGYGYGRSAGYGHQPYRNNNFPYYGSGPYGYGVTNGRTWNSTYAPYNSYYNSSYYNPYSGWGYSPFGIGIQQSYGW